MYFTSMLAYFTKIVTRLNARRPAFDIQNFILNLLKDDVVNEKQN